MAGDISLTSSRKMLPPSAWTNFPSRRRSAPVNAPFSWPNNSDSRSVSVSAAQLIFTKDASRRLLLKWIALAIISFPVPDSPVISTVACVAATCSTISRSRIIALLWPIRFRRSNFSPSLSFRYSFSFFSRRRSAVRAILICSSS